jgi:hypothetical protein
MDASYNTEAPMADAATKLREVMFDAALHVPVEDFWGVIEQRLVILAADVYVDLDSANVSDPGPGLVSFEVSALSRLASSVCASADERRAMEAMIARAAWEARQCENHAVTMAALRASGRR